MFSIYINDDVILYKVDEEIKMEQERRVLEGKKMVFQDELVHLVSISCMDAKQNSHVTILWLPLCYLVIVGPSNHISRNGVPNSLTVQKCKSSK